MPGRHYVYDANWIEVVQSILQTWSKGGWDLIGRILPLIDAQYVRASIWYRSVSGYNLDFYASLKFGSSPPRITDFFVYLYLHSGNALPNVIQLVIGWQ